VFVIRRIQIEQRGLYGMLRGLWPEVRSDPQAERFWLERPHAHEVAIGPDDTLVLAPSAYVWPHGNAFLLSGAAIVVLAVTATLALACVGARQPGQEPFVTAEGTASVAPQEETAVITAKPE
jgi:hypothetical protein